MLHQPTSHFHPATSDLSAEHKLVTLCRRAEALLAADLAATSRDSKSGDAFMAVDKPKRPTQPGDLPGGYQGMASVELRRILRDMRARPASERSVITKGILASGLLADYTRDVSRWEQQIDALKEEHGVIAARRAADKAGERTRKLLPEIVDMAATSSIGLAAKCRVMMAALEAGYGHFDVFADLASSIYEEGAQLSVAPRVTARPPRSDVGRPVHHH